MKRLALFLLACFTLAFGQAKQTPLHSQPARDFLRVDGQRLVANDGVEFRIRAMGTGSTASDPLEKDYEEIARRNFNAGTVFLSYERFYNEAEPEKYSDAGFKRLDQHIALARKHGLRVIQWTDLANKTVARIRKIDNHHIIFVERLYGEFGTRREMAGLDLAPERSFFVVPDPNVVYQFYFFERDEYTHQHAPWREDRDISIHYPDPRFEIVYREAVNDRGRVFPFDKNYLKFYLERQLEFGAKHKVPMFVWSFGLTKSCFEGQGGLEWLRDTTSLFREHNVDWSFGPYRDDDTGVSDNPEALRIISPAAESR